MLLMFFVLFNTPFTFNELVPVATIGFPILITPPLFSPVVAFRVGDAPPDTFNIPAALLLTNPLTVATPATFTVPLFANVPFTVAVLRVNAPVLVTLPVVVPPTFAVPLFVSAPVSVPV